MKLMTEVFDAWAAERLQTQTQSYFPPNAAPYSPPQPYPHAQPYQQAQPYAPAQPYPQMQPYSQGRPQSLYQNGPPPPAANPMSPPLTPNTPLPLYTSPIAQHAEPVTAYGYRAPQGGAIEMLAELPGEALLSAPTPVPVRSASTEVSSSQVLLARELWG